jgi:protein-tyrosine phosphatase
MSFIEYKTINIYISYSPTDENIQSFIEEIKIKNIKHIIRLYKPLYCSTDIKDENINLYNWNFDDIHIPSKKIINKWLKLLKNTHSPILIYCSFGLSRPTIFAAIALIENGISNENAINIVRKYGYLNTTQIMFLSNYKKNNNILKKYFNYKKLH